MDLLIPITRFNRGEANKIFDEVRLTGSKIVVKNNAPACVLMSPEAYKELVYEIDEMRLYALTAERLAEKPDVFYSHDDVMSELGVTNDDLKNISMEYGVDFE
jgi:PHD/YefM family antitoxin component YafN of YafNO toxin-antitoxin module